MEQDIRGVGADLLDVEVGREGAGQVTPVVHERQVGGASGDLLDRVMGVMFGDGDLEPGWPFHSSRRAGGRPGHALLLRRRPVADCRRPGLP